MKKNINKIAIEVKNVTKEYHIGTKSSNFLLRDELTDFFRNIFRKRKRDKTSFLALNDVSFSVKQGETIGIIGPNGAGKSTILKILSKITYPTKGEVVLNGRVASLLEVGTGFNPELTGRENIYLNGAILGMTRKEINSKFDEIVNFAEVGKFLDTPVKRYSSGMYIRLAFSIAAHLDPEILLIDEVLAVGDAKFQRKSLGKIDEITENKKRTVVFVSHDLNAIKNLCQKTILVHDGKIVEYGETSKVISTYLKKVRGDVPQIGLSFGKNSPRKGTGEIRITKVRLVDKTNNKISSVVSGGFLKIRLNYKIINNVKIQSLLVGMLFKTELGSPVFLSHNILTGNDFGELNGEGVIEFSISKLPLVPANYNINFSLMKNNGVGGEYYDNIDDAFTLRVDYGDYYGTGILPSPLHGSVLTDGKWNILNK